MLTECALGVEVAVDRSHTSIVAAGALDGMVGVELVAYLPGTDASAAVVELLSARQVVAVVIDPRSGAATLLRPLTAAGVKVTEPSTSDLAVATGSFLDELAAGRLRHGGQPELTAAVRAGTQRPAGGAQVWDRRGAVIDVSPLTAATLALWGWLYRPLGRASSAPWGSYGEQVAETGTAAPVEMSTGVDKPRAPDAQQAWSNRVEAAAEE